MPVECAAQTLREAVTPRPSPVTPTVDCEPDGVQPSAMPYRRDDSAWGSVVIPICVVNTAYDSKAPKNAPKSAREGNLGLGFLRTIATTVLT
jgi:hypothetical protein